MKTVINKKNDGFSLMELILAVAIFSLGAFAMITLFIDSGQASRLAVERSEATYYAVEGLNAVRSIRDSGWSNLTVGAHGLVGDGGSWSFVGESDLIDNKYTRVISISAGEDSNTLNVTASVSWFFNTARESSITIDTVVTNWALE